MKTNINNIAVTHYLLNITLSKYNKHWYFLKQNLSNILVYYS